MAEVPPKLDDLYLMVSSIYAEQNAQRPPSATFSHFVETCGMLSVIDRKKKREDITIVDALCKSLGWYFPLLAKFRVVSVEELVYRKFPYTCPYCRALPHRDVICKTTQGTESSVNHHALNEHYHRNNMQRPRRLNEWQLMFDRIYPRDLNSIGVGRSSLGLLEEVGELAEAVRVFDKHPKYFAGEAADVFSYIMGMANEYQLITQRDELPPFDFEAEFLRRYPGLCLQCGHESCICPSVPESTVGRLSKELDLSTSAPLFCADMAPHLERGRVMGGTVLESLGGLPAVADKLPLDRGETNRALLLLCLKLAVEIQERDAPLAEKLRDAAVKAATDTRKAGSRDHAPASQDVVSLLGNVWPLLGLAAVPDDSTMAARIGKLLRAQSCKIGIVTALPKEFAAMRIMFDEETPHHVVGDPNEYIVGLVRADDGRGSHVIALTLLKELGNNSAATVAANLLRSFSSVQDIMMVGIAGGVPSYDQVDKHIRLGDVIVSDNEGVVQYDNLKVGVKSITIRSNADKPSPRMLGVVKAIEADRLMRKYPWEHLIDRGAQLLDGVRPVDVPDELFKWDGDKPTEVRHLTDDTWRSGYPKLHYGRIGAANTLLKDPALRDKIGRDCNVRAVEMEGSGVADAAWNAGQRYIVIRGICDYCDPKKNDKWQGYAAVCAAAYARVVIARMPLELPSE
jgi:nucleoside phosphorylase/NTP pyrophosphatase (non-canonical NTP hydrolase)